MKQQIKYVTEDLDNIKEEYWGSKDEWLEFSKKIEANLDKHEKAGHKDICLSFEAQTYSEYGEDYPYIKLEINYLRPMTEDEIKEEEIKRIKDKEQKELYKIQNECKEYLKTHTNYALDVIEAMIRNQGVLMLYKEGKLKL